jgi:thiol-disulfide isomerase/thioredoxin
LRDIISQNYMNKNTGIIIGVIALLVIFGGVYASMKNKDDAKIAEDKAMMEKKAMEEKETMKKDGTSMMDKGDVMMKVGSYEAYSADKIARAETGDVVLFFHASWCPSCRGLNSSIESNLKSIPEDVTILKADYDKETELKKKYGVTYQHTLVQVDKDGNMIKKWSGGGSLDNLLSQIQ